MATQPRKLIVCCDGTWKKRDSPGAIAAGGRRECDVERATRSDTQYGGTVVGLFVIAAGNNADQADSRSAGIRYRGGLRDTRLANSDASHREARRRQGNAGISSDSGQRQCLGARAVHQRKGSVSRAGPARFESNADDAALLRRRPDRGAAEIRLRKSARRGYTRQRDGCSGRVGHNHIQGVTRHAHGLSVKSE